MADAKAREKQARALARQRCRVLDEVTQRLEQESLGLHVRDANDDYGLQRAIRIVQEMKAR